MFKAGMRVVAVLVVGALPVSGAHAQGKGGGSIVCWKDASGKVVGCGDKVPAEFANSGTRELDKRGNVRKTGESAEEAAKRKAKDAEQAKQKEDDQKKAAEQKRKDSALLATFANEKEIDLKRDRELQAIENTLTQQRAALKLANDRLADAQGRAAAFEKGNKDKKPAPPGIKEDIARAEGEKGRLEKDVADKEKSKESTMTTYAEYRKRFQELKGTAPTPAASTPPAAAAPTPAAPAKK